MIRLMLSRVLLPVALGSLVFGLMIPSQAAANSPAGNDTVLKAADISTKIFPDKVFYHGQVAPVQMRNTGGVRFADDAYVLAGLVDNSGYSSGVRQKYQGYFFTEVPIEINGQSLKPGAYGIGFVEGTKFVVTDLGSNNLLEITGKHDTEIKRPVPLQFLAAPEAGTYRLYLGRDFVEIHRAQ
jgi:hypothetical protein